MINKISLCQWIIIISIERVGGKANYLTRPAERKWIIHIPIFLAKKKKRKKKKEKKRKKYSLQNDLGQSHGLV